jgi:hypothetical protein
VHERLGDLEHRGHQALCLGVVGIDAPHDPADPPEVELLGERRSRRDVVEVEEAREVAWRSRQELAVGLQHHLRVLDRPEGRPAHDRGDRVCLEREFGDDAEVPAAAANRPEEVRVLVGTRLHEASVREDDLRGQQVVDREAVAAGEVAVAAAQGQPCDASGRDDPGGDREPVVLRGGIDLAPEGTAADAHRAGCRVDRDLLQRREVDDHTVVDAPEAAAVVATAPHGDAQVVVACEGDHRGDVRRARAARDHGGPLVEHRVEEGACFVVGRVVRADQLTGEAPCEGVCGGASRGRSRAHRSSFAPSSREPRTPLDARHDQA